MSKIIPEIVVSNMERSMAFYNSLGFVKDNEGIVDENGAQWYSLAMGDATVWLLREDIDDSLERGAPRGNGVHLFLPVEDVDAVYDRLNKSGLQMNIVKEIETLWYGLREFKLQDPDGYLWIINTPVSQEGTESAGGEG